MKMLKKFFIGLFFTSISLFAENAVEITNQQIEVNDNSAVLRFILPCKVSVQCFYGTDPLKPDRSVIMVSETDNVELFLPNLKKGSIYYYQIVCYTKGKKSFYKNGAFKTTGRPELRIYSVEYLPDKYETTIKFFVTDEISAEVEIDNKKYKCTLSGNKEIESYPNLKENLFIYQVCIKDLKPSKKYTYKFLGVKDNQNIKTNGEFYTLENNIALGKPVIGTFNGTYIADNFELGGDVINRVTDGKYGYLDGMAVSNDPELSDQWLIVDLGKEYPVKEVVCIWRSLAYPVKFYLSLSVDGKEWICEQVVEGAQESSMAGNMPVKLSRAFFDCKDSRYVKLLFPVGGEYVRRYEHYRFLQLVELKVFPKE